jgi:hypothetical protein
MSALPRPELPPGPQRDLVDALHDLHHRAGWPSLRTLAKAAGCSHTTVSTAFSSPRLPAWGLLELLVEAMDGDPRHFHQLWVAASSPATDRADAAPRIAGRRAELAAVRRHLESGTGLLLVTGEAGIGKTNLVTAAALSLPVAVGQCLPLSREVPLLPIVDMLRSVHAVDEGAWLLGALDTCPPPVRETIGILLPEVRSDSPPDGSWAALQLFTAVGWVFGALRSLRPIALLLEDLHWSDATTLDLLEHLLSTGPLPPLVATYRIDDPDVSDRTAEWALRARRQPYARTMVLGPLDLSETRDQLHLLAGHDPDEGDLDRIFSRSKGQPLFTEQLARADSQGMLLPDLLADVLDGRLGVLEGDAWSVARTLGLADRPLEFTLLMEASGLDAERTTSALRELSRRHLLHTDHSEEAPTLRHPLMSEAIRRRLVPGEKPAAHRLLAIALSHAPDARAAEVARHWEYARDPHQSLVWWVRAAEAASDRFALDEIHAALSRVLELWPPGAPAVPEVGYKQFEIYAIAIDNAGAVGSADLAARWAREAVELDLSDEQRVDILQIAGEVEFSYGDPEAGFVLLGQALAIHETLPPDVGFVDTLHWRARHLIDAGRWGEAEADLHRAHGLAVELEDTGRERQLATSEGQLCGLRGEFDEAAQLFASARALPVDPGEDINGELRVAVREVDVLLRAATSPDEIARRTSAVAERAQQVGFDAGPACALTLQLCDAWLRAGETRRAAESVASVWDPQLTFAVAPRHLAKALVDLRAGHVEESLKMQTAVAALRVSSSVEIAWATHHAEIELWADRPELAAGRLDRALSHMLSGDGWRVSSAVASMCARAHADHADQAGLDRPARRRLGEQISKLLAEAPGSPFSTAAVGRQVRADAATWRAEIARATLASSVETWAVAAAEWDALSRPHDAAYCRWRGAQVALAQGQGTVAARLLKRAARDAREHVPLSAAIAATARGS